MEDGWVIYGKVGCRAEYGSVCSDERGFFTGDLEQMKKAAAV